MDQIGGPGGRVLSPLWYGIASLLVAVFPEHVKKQERFAKLASPVAHVVSGFVEIFASIGIYIVGMIRYVHDFFSGPGMAYLNNESTWDQGKFMGLGALGYLSYIVKPTSMFLLYCLVEGMVRALEVPFSERKLGMAMVSVPWRLVEWVQQMNRRKHIEMLLGPERPDEVVLLDKSRWGMLEIYSAREKPWAEKQVLDREETFFILNEKNFMPHGRYHVYRYLFKPMEDREVLRGVVIRYPDNASQATPEIDPS